MSLCTRRSLLAGALLPLVRSTEAAQGSWKAGLAAVPITPRTPLWMAGYAGRTKPSEGTLLELHAKALALDDGTGRPAVLVTADLLGFPAGPAARISKRAAERFGIPRERLILNGSHTHGGPVVGDMLRVGYRTMSDEQWSAVRAYTAELEDHVVECIGRSLKDLRPARLSFGHGQAGFAKNRRPQFNPNGPVDHDVPVLRVEAPDGNLRGVVFGYACHNTTLVGDTYQFHGDYAGFTQAALEKAHPGATALYVAGCGADANPLPRGKMEHVQAYSAELAKAVEAVLSGSMRPVDGSLRCAYEVVPVRFATPPSREEFQAKLSDANVYIQRHAKEMLALLDRDGRLPTEYPYPVQVWQFGDDVTLIPLAGEVVVDYALRLKRELGPERTWVAGYSNDVFAYIPSLRVLREGGYEGRDAMIYYNQPGPFTSSIEEIIIRTVHALVERTRPR